MKKEFDYFEKAFWISPEGANPGKKPPKEELGNPAGYLKKTFSAKKDKKYTLYIGVHGVAEIYVNGTLVTDAVLFPGPFSYYFELPVGVFDITPFVRDGENEFSVVLGNGWYRSHTILGNRKNFFGTDLSIIASIYCESECVLCSDESFLSSVNGPVKGNDIVLGEIYDAGIREITYDHNARLVKLSKDPVILPRLTGYSRIVAHESVSAVKVGEGLFDLGRLLSGAVFFSFSGAGEGEVITLSFFDSSDEEKRSNERKRFLKYKTISGENSYTSHFSIFEGRFIFVEADFPIEDLKIKVIPYYSEIEERTVFHCSDERLNKAFEKCVDAEKTFFTGMFSDGYSSIGHGAGKTILANACAEGALCLMSAEEQLSWYIRCAAEWQHKSGKIRNLIPPNVSPSMKQYEAAQSCGWGDVVIDVPYLIYSLTGDTKILKDNYHVMKKWYGSLLRRAEKRPFVRKVTATIRKINPYERYVIDKGHPLGDSADANPGPNEAHHNAEWYKDMGTAYLAHSGLLLTKIAELLLKDDSLSRAERTSLEKDMQNFKKRGTKALAAYRYTFADVKGLSDCSADFLIRALFLDLLPDEEGGVISKRKAAERLNELVTAPSFDLTSLGPLALSKVTHVLMEAGFSESAYDLLFMLSEKEGPYPPEYLTAIGGFIVKYILGISFEDGKVQKNPIQKGRLKNISGHFISPDGTDIVIGD
ncbi:MAG: alpha-L-rhamnosidase N-terminal domain-containing protein [Lachnospiraceae bacterium]|nr:alpha-L-rhamnosidase N-terminal domain-containing protein [Lachnospiraceae bacterium]